MYIQDIANFPVIPVGYNNQDGLSVAQNIQRFETLLLKEQPFVFLSEGPFPEEQASHEERKFVAAWVKKNRERLQRYVQAIIHIEAEQQQRLEAEQFAKQYINFTGYPMFVVGNQHQANILIATLVKPAHLYS